MVQGGAKPYTFTRRPMGSPERVEVRHVVGLSRSQHEEEGRRTYLAHMIPRRAAAPAPRLCPTR